MAIENNLKTKKEIKKIWDKCGKDYDKDHAHGLKSEREKLEWLNLLEQLVPLKPSKVLDVGAGTGFLSLLLCELGHDCKGIDLSEGMLKRAREKAKAQQIKKVNFVIGDAENLDEKDESYDSVINRHLVWTLPHPEKAIKEWVRVLKPEGRLIIIDGDWFYDDFFNKIKIFLGKAIISVKEKRNAFKGSGTYDKALIEKLPMMKDQNARKLVELVKNAGLEVEVKNADKVEKAEKEAMSIGYRLKNPYRRTIIIGRKK